MSAQKSLFLRELLAKYRLVVRFILTFLVVYIILSVAYKFYLDVSKTSDYYPDFITHSVAQQTKAVLNAFGYHTVMVPHPDEPTIKTLVRGKYIVRINEGCNAVSVIILFVSFIIAFSGKFKTTVLFALFGSAVIYIVNVFRVAIITLSVYHYPQYSDVIHSVVFPAIIYGLVFLLWIIWVNRFSAVNTTKDV